MHKINDTTIYNIDRLDNLQFAEFHFDEYPKFESTIIVGATYDGYEMDIEQLEELNADKYLLMALCLNYIRQLNP